MAAAPDWDVAAALLAAARGYAGGAKLRFELAQGRNEPAIIEAR